LGSYLFFFGLVTFDCFFLCPAKPQGKRIEKRILFKLLYFPITFFVLSESSLGSSKKKIYTQPLQELNVLNVWSGGVNASFFTSGRGRVCEKGALNGLSLAILEEEESIIPYTLIGAYPYLSRFLLQAAIRGSICTILQLL
jgi:hypothetical protein